MNEWNFRFPGSLFIVGLYIKVLRIWEWIWSLLKLSKVSLTASYSKIAMKPSSPEMWTSLDYRWKQVIFKCSSKQVKKKKVKCLSHTELSRYCKQQIWSITIRNIYMHSISVTHPKRAHFSFLSLTMTASKKYLLPLPLQTSDSLSISQSTAIAQNSHKKLSCVPASTQHLCWEIQTHPRSYRKETGCTFLMAT